MRRILPTALLLALSTVFSFGQRTADPDPQSARAQAAGPVDIHAADFGVDYTGAADSTAKLQAAIHAATASPKSQSGAVLDIGVGTLSICNLSIDRPLRLYGHGGAYLSSATVFHVQPGCMGLIVDQGNTSVDGGSASFSDLGYFEVQGTVANGNTTSGSDTITGFAADDLAKLKLSPGDYITVMGANRGLWVDIFPYATTQVQAVTANSITVANGFKAAITSLPNGAYVLKAGLPVSRGTSETGSRKIAITTGCSTWHPGDPLMGPGIKPESTANGSVLEPNFVTGVECQGDGGTLSIIQPAADGAGAGVFYRGPVAGILVRTQVYLHNITVRFTAGNGLDTNSNAAGYKPATGADGSEYERIFSLQTGGSCVHDQGGDSNVLTYINGYSHHCGQGGHISDSFLGTVVINEEVADSSGPSYATTNPNAAHVFIDAYAEGGGRANVWSSQTLVLGGSNPGNTSGRKNGTVIRNSGQISPNFFAINNQSGSTATLTLGSNVLTNVTKIGQWHRGDTLLCDLCPTNGAGQPYTYVLDTDGVSKLTISSHGTITSADNEPITTTHTEFNIGTRAAGLNSAFGLYYGQDNAHSTGYEFQFDDPSYLASPVYQPGWFSLRYRNTNAVLSLSTDLSGGVDLPPDRQATPVIKFPQGLQVGAGANSVCLTSSTSGSAPTGGYFTPGCLVLSSSAGIWQQTTPAKSYTGGHGDTGDGTAMRVDIRSLTRAGNTVTLNTASPHSFAPGMYILVVGVTSTGKSEFDGIFGPIEVQSNTQLSYTQNVPEVQRGDKGEGGSIALSPYILDHLDEKALAGCARGDTITDSAHSDAMKPGTTILNISAGMRNFAVLSRNTTASHAGDALVCSRQPKAHIATTCTATQGSEKLESCNQIGGWAVGDTVIGHSIPSGTFVMASPSGELITLSQKATSSGVVSIGDAQFVSFGKQRSIQVRTLGTPIAPGTCQAQPSATVPDANSQTGLSWSGSGPLPPSWMAGINVQLWVSDTTVTPYLCNVSAKQVTPAAATINIR